VLFPRFSNANPFSFRVTEERTILVNGEIRNEIGAVVAEAKDSQLFVLLGADYDVNSDSSAYEIVDEQLRPVLQFYRRDNPETLQINGLLTAFEKMDIPSVYEESRLRAACL